jgi:hypothetical protein
VQFRELTLAEAHAAARAEVLVLDEAIVSA